MSTPHNEPTDLKQFEIHFSYVEKPEFPKSKTNVSTTVICEHFMEAVQEVYIKYPNAEIWTVTHRHRWDGKHKVIVTSGALGRLTQNL